jgi:hypothetical protein
MNNNKFYDFNEINKKFKNKKINWYDDYLFKLKLFNRMKNIYFARTPESDSLYRRRNRLIILVFSCLFYVKTQNGIFEKVEFDLLSQNKAFMNKLVYLFNLFI